MKGTISFFYNNALIPIPTKGTMPGSFKRVFNYKCFNLRTREGYDRYRLAGPPQMYSFNPRTHKKYDQPISGTDRLMYALIPVPMKGTIFLFTSLPCFLLALIPVPMKGTITVYYDIVKPLMSFNPRTHEGYDHDFFTNEKLPFNSFNPRTHEGYDFLAPLLSWL